MSDQQPVQFTLRWDPVSNQTKISEANAPPEVVHEVLLMALRVLYVKRGEQRQDGRVVTPWGLGGT